MTNKQMITYKLVCKMRVVCICLYLVGKTCNHAIVMALLFTKGECHGIHGFLVQLRDFKTHQPLQG